MEAAAADEKALAMIHYHANAFIDTMVLRSAVDLSIPDAIRRLGSPSASATEIAAALSVPDSVRLRRRLRYLVDMGILSFDPSTARYTLTRAGDLLSDHPASLSPFVSMVTHEVTRNSWYSLADTIREGDNGHTAFETTHGRPFFEVIGERADIRNLFDRAMAVQTMTLMPGVIRALKENHIESMMNATSFLDVGGGTGATARWIADAFYNMHCAVLELPRSIEHAIPGPVEFISGDMFHHIPKTDIILLKRVLHDFGDDECVEILKRCKDAIPRPDGAVIIVEAVIDDDANAGDTFGRMKLMLDMTMMVLVTGKERSRKDFQAILHQAGFYLHMETKVLLGYSVMEARLM